MKDLSWYENANTSTFHRASCLKCRRRFERKFKFTIYCSQCTANNPSIYSGFKW